MYRTGDAFSAIAIREMQSSGREHDRDISWLTLEDRILGVPVVRYDTIMTPSITEPDSVKLP